MFEQCRNGNTMRTRAERRYNDIIKALRKREITRNKYHTIYDTEYYDNLHQYSKNKIHCSCPMCSFKTNNHGRNKWYGKGSKNWKHSDLVKLAKLDINLVDIE